jgi:hypothetical protein
MCHEGLGRYRFNGTHYFRFQFVSIGRALSLGAPPSGVRIRNAGLSSHRR